MTPIKLYLAKTSGDPQNSRYPTEITVDSAESLSRAAKRDHVTAKYRNCTRGRANFIESDCVPFDCDNGHTDDPQCWVTPADVADAFPDVGFYVVYSRNHERQKGSQSARPRFHVYFPIEIVTDEKEYSKLKLSALDRFPFFDRQAADSARFLFGVDAPLVEIYDRAKLLTDVLSAYDTFAERELSGIIPEGSRNSTLSRIAGRLAVRYGDTEEAYGMFLENANRCDPPLDDAELNVIWKSAAGFGQRISKEDEAP